MSTWGYSLYIYPPPTKNSIVEEGFATLEAARESLEQRLQRRYGDQWERINEHQYALKGDNKYAVAYLFETHSEIEQVDLDIAALEERIAKLKAKRVTLRE